MRAAAATAAAARAAAATRTKIAYIRNVQLAEIRLIESGLHLAAVLQHRVARDILAPRHPLVRRLGPQVIGLALPLARASERHEQALFSAVRAQRRRLAQLREPAARAAVVQLLEPLAQLLLAAQILDERLVLGDGHELRILLEALVHGRHLLVVRHRDDCPLQPLLVRHVVDAEAVGRQQAPRLLSKQHL